MNQAYLSTLIRSVESKLTTEKSKKEEEAMIIRFFRSSNHENKLQIKKISMIIIYRYKYTFDTQIFSKNSI